MGQSGRRLLLASAVLLLEFLPCRSFTWNTVVSSGHCQTYTCPQHPLRPGLHRRRDVPTSKPRIKLLCDSTSSGNEFASHDAYGEASSPSFRQAAAMFQGLTTEEIHKTVVRQGSRLPCPIDCAIAKLQVPKQLISVKDKVPGCVASVYVQTLLSLSGSTEENWMDCPISVRGDADAMLSRGLLSVLSAAVEGLSAAEVLSLNPDAVADQLGLRSSMSRGRNDGMANMVKTIQSQIGTLLNERPITGETLNPDIKQQEKKTVALLLSGGVDSSVALHLLLQQGYAVTAFYLRIWLEDELAHLGVCPWEDDYWSCQKVCQQAGVPLETISLQQQYRDRVIRYVINEAEQGRTPNPDILCNSRIKFGCFYDEISDRNFDFVASGHYAQVLREHSGPLVRLVRAPDPVKDQSYFLCSLTQKQLSRVMFPIGHLLKSQVRALAHEFQLPNRDRPDSQGLCFLGKVKFDYFLHSYLGERGGPIIDAATGERLGTHRGLWFHTVGQRKGIGKVLDPVATSRGPWYVVAKDPERNMIFCSNTYDESIFNGARSKVAVENIHWIKGEKPASLGTSSGSARFTMKIRHGPKLVCGSLRLDCDNTGHVELDHKDSGLAPGQYIVLYEDDECLGGAVISERHWAKFLMDSSLLAATNLRI